MTRDTEFFSRAKRELQFTDAEMSDVRHLSTVLARAQALKQQWIRARQEQLRQQAAIKASFGGGQ